MLDHHRHPTQKFCTPEAVTPFAHFLLPIFLELRCCRRYWNRICDLEALRLHAAPIALTTQEADVHSCGASLTLRTGGVHYAFPSSTPWQATLFTEIPPSYYRAHHAGLMACLLYVSLLDCALFIFSFLSTQLPSTQHRAWHPFTYKNQ